MRDALDPEDALRVDQPKVDSAFHGFLSHEIRDGRPEEELFEFFPVDALPVIEVLRHVDLEFSLAEFLAEELLVTCADNNIVAMLEDLDAKHYDLGSCLFFFLDVFMAHASLYQFLKKMTKKNDWSRRESEKSRDGF
jgi:hypothetical protein